MKKNYKRLLILVTLFFILISYLFNSSMVLERIINYTDMFITKVFPINFILYIIIGMLIDYNLLEFLSLYLKINSVNLFIFILSILNGFPSGSRYSIMLLDKNLINKDIGNKLLMFSHFPNPMFVLGTISLIINKRDCVYILISIIISNFIIMLFIKNNRIIINNNFNNNSFSNILNKCIINSFKTIILIYGTSLFFYLISVLFKFSNIYLCVFINGLFDITNGIMTTNLIDNNFIKCIFILFFLSFGSISIHMQVKEIIENKLDYKYFVFGRIISFIISIIIFSVLYT